jgi:glutathione S-transferase
MTSGAAVIPCNCPIMLPVLYSFRRCPYAMRARLALHASGIAVELREVVLSDKPGEMLAASAKGSVPVLVLPDSQVIDQSWDIMLWALHRHDPDGWLGVDSAWVEAARPLISENDTTFKHALDRYKYPGRHPGHSPAHYRGQAETFVLGLEERLSATACLLGDAFTIADAAVFPFIRQFAAVDQDWFASVPYPALRRWLNDISGTQRFAATMYKYPPWKPGDNPVIFSPENLYS